MLVKEFHWSSTVGMKSLLHLLILSLVPINSIGMSLVLERRWMLSPFPLSSPYLDFVKFLSSLILSLFPSVKSYLSAQLFLKEKWFCMFDSFCSSSLSLSNLQKRRNSPDSPSNAGGPSQHIVFLRCGRALPLYSAIIPFFNFVFCSFASNSSLFLTLDFFFWGYYQVFSCQNFYPLIGIEM